MKRPTSLDYAILGLLNQNPQSGYRVRKAFENTALGNYSSSPGAIYPAINRLQELELVEKTNMPNSKKMIFKSTEKGTELLKEWFLKPIEINGIATELNELLLRFGFMDQLIDREEQLNFLGSLKVQLEVYIKSLKEYHKNNSTTLPLNGRLAFEHGISSYETTLKWCQKAIKTITNSKS